ncbi:MAG: ABC transporter ATP-binding protein/permease [Clostridia bacterium]|nr:ABC transporter ATP-binding protein/permease [Clostridia bacterium]
MSVKSSNLIKRFLPYYKKYIGILVFDLFCALLTTVCELVLPMIVREITDRATGGNISALTVSFVLRVGLFYLVLRIIDTVANYYMASVGHIMGTKMETDMRRDMFAHLQRLSFEFYDNTKIGSIMSRITSDLFDVTEFAHHCPEEFFIAFIKIAAAFCILCVINVPLTLIIFSVVPPMIVILMIFNGKMKSGFRESRRTVAELNSAVEDSLLGIRVVKSFSNEYIEEEKFEQGNVKFLNIKKKVYRYMGGFQSCTRLFDGLMYITVVIAGAIFIIKDKINTADLVAYLLFVNTLLTSIRRIVEFAEQFQRGMTGIERFFEIVDCEPDIVDKENAVVLKNVKGEVKLNDVCFKYVSRNNTVLDHVNISVGVGDNIALVGPSGGGKTTICSLIPRFYDVDSGSITIDGIDIKDVTLESLRANIGIVQQDVYLFSGSVYENIAYGKPNATMEEIYESARLAGADEFIKSLPDGYDTYVGERGVKLSGGQKQRISIARVFLKNPPILILDEATSALDNESEKIVQHSLERLAKGRTTITIAHRLTTIKNADKIIVLTKDGIVENGTHNELIEKDGIYSKLYMSYS